ncbi:MAG: hypothetical protein PHE09_17470 [Oscillospiraceae bacterium]|nr:hypothetical protein [Oscillospiraceae bacterium]
MSELAEQAKQKLQDELKKFSGGSKEKAVSKSVCKTLDSFCNEEFFAQAVWDSDKTLSDCCKAIMSGAGSSISDLDVYKAAVKFYLPGADVKFKMEITMNGTAESSAPESENSGKIVSLLDLL